MKNLDEKILERYLDGELSEQESKAVEKLLENSSESRESAGRISRISEYMRIMEEQSVDSISFEGFDKRVLIEAENQKAQKGLFSSFSVWIREFFEHRKVVWVPVLSVAGAVSALIITVGLNSSPGVPDMPGSEAPSRWQASSAHEKMSSEARIDNPDEVEGEEYSVITEEGESIGVVWIEE